MISVYLQFLPSITDQPDVYLRNNVEIAFQNWLGSILHTDISVVPDADPPATVMFALSFAPPQKNHDQFLYGPDIRPMLPNTTHVRIFLRDAPRPPEIYGTLDFEYTDIGPRGPVFTPYNDSFRRIITRLFPAINIDEAAVESILDALCAAIHILPKARRSDVAKRVRDTLRKYSLHPLILRRSTTYAQLLRGGAAERAEFDSFPVGSAPLIDRFFYEIIRREVRDPNNAAGVVFTPVEHGTEAVFTSYILQASPPQKAQMVHLFPLIFAEYPHRISAIAARLLGL